MPFRQYLTSITLSRIFCQGGREKLHKKFIFCIDEKTALRFRLLIIHFSMYIHSMRAPVPGNQAGRSLYFLRNLYDMGLSDQKQPLPFGFFEHLSIDYIYPMRYTQPNARISGGY